MANPTAPNPNDCLTLFSTAISSSFLPQQLSALSDLYKLLENNPGFVPVMFETLVGMVKGPMGGVGEVRKWVAEVMELGVRGGNLRAALQSAEALHRLLTLSDPADPDLLPTKKLSIQVLSTSYTLYFSHSTTKPSDPKHWGLSNQLKSVALQLWRSESTDVGLRVAACRFVQRVIQVGTRGGVGERDPRRRGEDPSVALVPSSHPYLKPRELEHEATALLEESIRMLYQSRSPDLVSALITTLGLLIRSRPTHAHLVLTALSSWSPTASALSTQNLTFTALRGVEKILRITLSHFDRGASPQVSIPPILVQSVREGLINQSRRMEVANEEWKRKREEVGRLKRNRIVETVEGATAKRPRVEDQGEGFGAAVVPVGGGQSQASVPVVGDGAQPFGVGAGTNLMPGFDVKTLPVELVVELIIANFQVLTEAALAEAIERIRVTLPPAQAAAATPAVEAQRQQAWSTAEPSQKQQLPPPVPQHAIIDPLKVDLEDPEDLHFDSSPAADDPAVEDGKVEKMEAEDGVKVDVGVGAGLLALDKFELPPAELLEGEAREGMLKMTLERMAETGMDAKMLSGGALERELWVSLVARLATRGLDTQEGEEVRRTLFEFVTADLGNRIEFARVWLNEEWFSEHAGILGQSHGDDSAEDRPYARWLSSLLDHIVAHSSNQDKALSQFMVDLPQIPQQELQRLGGMCTNPDQLQIGFITLRELATLRPPVRQAAMDILLGLTTHSARQTRNAAIVSVKSWVVEAHPLGELVVSFALQLLERLQQPLKKDEADGDADMEVEKETEEGEEVVEVISCAVVEKGVVVEGMPQPSSPKEVVQYLELLLALSVRDPDLLDRLFRGYPHMPPEVQESIPTIITPLIRSLGAKHSKVASLIQTCPAGSEPLVLRMLTILTEKGRAPPPIVEAIKALASEQDLSPRFIIPIIADLDKPDIMRHLPCVVSLLNGTPAEKALIRGVFEVVVQMPPQNFGSVSSNVPRVKSSELLTPVELMSLLHRSEKETGLKPAIEAIGICFSMTEVFKPEVLAAFMQQIVDELTLPTLFLRTVIQAVQTYKSLQAFVSTTLLSRLIIKKLWTQPQLWEGFIRCAKIIAPHSFGALLQLPRDQLREVVTKQPLLKPPLRDYVVKKAGNNKSRVASTLEILSDNSSTPQANMTPPPEGGMSPVPAVG